MLSLNPFNILEKIFYNVLLDILHAIQPEAAYRKKKFNEQPQLFGGSKSMGKGREKDDSMNQRRHIPTGGSTHDHYTRCVRVCVLSCNTGFYSCFE